VKGKDFDFVGSQFADKDKNAKEMLEELVSLNGEQIDSVTIENCSVNLLKVLKSVATPLIELSLQDAGLLPQDCRLLAMDPRVAVMKKLDLSCNAIGFQGLSNLMKAGVSHLKQLESLSLFNCSID
jgi:hypothetical protein